jgi:ribosomal protein S18 acetylase RimI-like enzyme
MIGFIAGDIRDHQKVSWISTIGVLPEYRGQGIGAQLLEACEKKLPTPSIKLCVRATNDTAIRLYRRFGYDIAGTWQRYYQDGEDALVMEKIRL